MKQGRRKRKKKELTFSSPPCLIVECVKGKEISQMCCVARIQRGSYVWLVKDSNTQF
jgi:hypothetical protein